MKKKYFQNEKHDKKLISKKSKIDEKEPEDIKPTIKKEDDGLDKVLSKPDPDKKYVIMEKWLTDEVQNMEDSSSEEKPMESEETPESEQSIEHEEKTAESEEVEEKIDEEETVEPFQSNETGKRAIVEQENENYLIDENGDGEWDYSFDIEFGLSKYQKNNKTESPAFEMIYIAISSCIVLFFLKRRK